MTEVSGSSSRFSSGSKGTFGTVPVQHTIESLAQRINACEEENDVLTRELSVQREASKQLATAHFNHLTKEIAVVKGEIAVVRGEIGAIRDLVGKLCQTVASMEGMLGNLKDESDFTPKQKSFLSGFFGRGK
ncbi:hypothetical protein BD410DRAFT_846412 [Rickenella mellea]|uniref:Uncharacterized protein n=1 Tax=Rickenella mellea TaxID=50990 RepID=A0A4Y7PF81_9AGAM|nr:hypothetical protein BD410DRAFT_846412 [Rickenella mellea]